MQSVEHGGRSGSGAAEDASEHGRVEMDVNVERRAESLDCRDSPALAVGDSLAGRGATQNIMKQAASLKNVELPLLLPGIKVNTSPTDFAPIEQEQLAKFNGEKWETFGEIFDAYRR